MRLRWLTAPLCVAVVLVTSCGAGHHNGAAPTARATGLPTPVLGWTGFLDGHGGWGTAQPERVSNEGDDSSFVYQVHWRGWGTPVAYGLGKRHAFKRAGVNYRHGVVDELRASNLGLCHGRLTYRTLFTRQARSPGMTTLGKWEEWTSHHGAVCGRFADLITP